jgi:hypothetical protein
MIHPQPLDPVNRRRFTVSSVRRSLFFEPLAMLFALLVLPVLSWVDVGVNNAIPRPFQAGAQSPGGCSATGNTIIRNYCVGSTAYLADLTQLETDAVSSYLAFHNIPPADAHIIYDDGRTDLRTGVRGYMLTQLIGIIEQPASSRTPHQQALYNWLQAIVQQNEINYFGTALSHYQSFVADPCHFQLDSVVAASSKISFDGTPFCFNSYAGLFAGPPVPAESYFLAYGMRKSYATVADQYSYAGALTADTQVNVGEVAGISSAAGAIVVAGAAVGLFNLMAFIVGGSLAAFAATGSAAGLTYSAAAVITSTSVEAIGGAAAAAAGPVAILLIAVAIGIAAGIQAFDNQQNIDNIAHISADHTKALNTPPDLKTFLDDTTGLGAYKLNVSFVTQTLPEVESTAVLPAHRTGVDPIFDLVNQAGPTEVFSDTLTYKDWKGTVWSAKTWGGWFVQQCLHDADVQTCAQASSITGSIRYQAFDGTQWSAARLGNKFVSVKGKAATTDIACAADQTTGFSNAADLSVCVSYVSASLPVLDQNGAKVKVSLSPFTAPVFTGSTVLSFSPGLAGTQTITATGNPAPTICATAGSLGAHFSIPGCSTGSLTITFDGNSSVPVGDSALSFSATNSAGAASQQFGVHVGTDVKIISPAILNTAYNQHVNFTVIAAGVPRPKLTIDPGVDLDGLTFADNGNGTATISGVAGTATLLGPCENVAGNTCPGIHATSPGKSDFQIFTVEVGAPPSPTALGPFSATFTSGVSNQLLLLSAGATTPVSWSLDPQFPGPSWLRFHNNGDGTATLSGVPPAGTTGTFLPEVLLTAAGTSLSRDITYTINVTDLPVITTPGIFNFTVGPSATQNNVIKSTTGTLSLGSALPQGIDGLPVPQFLEYVLRALTGALPGTGGQYTNQATATGANGSATQPLTINIYEGPKITSPPLVTLFAGKPAAINVNTTGYPAVATTQGTPTSAPTSPSQGLGTYFTTTGLPASMTTSNLNVLGNATGTLGIQGTPTAADIGTHKVQITAANGVGSPAQQALTLLVYPYSPTTAVNLLTSTVFTRDANNNEVATIVVANAGSATAQNVTFTSVKVDGVSGAVTPTSVASIGPASTATFTVTFAAGSLPVATVHSLTVAGSYSGGTFSSGGRVTLP